MPAYEIHDLVGRGGFGAVYRATRDGREVALKVLSSRADESTRKRFRDEARILSRLDHPCVVSVQPPAEVDGVWVLEMDFVSGQTLATLIQEKKRIPDKVALQIIERLADLLDYGWNLPGDDGKPLRLLHRDIKPANIVITRDGQVKLLDFGIARADFEDREAQSTMSVSGTRGYIAPERFTGRENQRTDVYSLGVLMHELLKGLKPQRARQQGDTILADPVLDMSLAMTSVDVDGRPYPADVRAMCRDLAGPIQSAGIEAWAARHIEPSGALPPDGRVGTTLGGKKRGGLLLPLLLLFGAMLSAFGGVVILLFGFLFTLTRG